MPPEIVSRKEPSLLDRLTPREREVILWVGEAKSNWEIGQIIGCSEATVKKHLYRAYAKLGVENRMQVVNLLLRSNPHGMASADEILRSAGARAVAASASVALALADVLSGWDLTLDFL
jgi:DNA-binding CsgD family transcriptional regulator